MSPFESILVLIVAIALQGLFAGYETGFVSANPIRIRYLAEEERRPRAIQLLHYIQRPDRMLTTLLIGTNLAVVTATIDISRQVSYWAPERYADVIATLIAAPVSLLFAEIIPKSIFRAHPNRLSLAVLPVIQVFYTLLSPLAIPITACLRALLRVMGERGRHLSPFMDTLEDVRVLVDEGADQGAIDREEQEMIHSVIDLQNIPAKEIMVPRINVQALPDTATRDEALALFEESGMTRIPVYHETIDHIIGVINAFDLLADPDPADEDIRRFVKEVMNVPDSMRVDDLFQALKKAKQHMAIVVDEYGGTDGLITIEDVLEEIFGEIHDEYDHEESMAYKVGVSACVLDARMSLEEASAFVGVPIVDESVETVAGWLTHVAGRIPPSGEVVEHGRFRAVVLEGSANRVAKIRLEILPAPPAQPRKDGTKGHHG